MRSHSGTVPGGTESTGRIVLEGLNASPGQKGSSPRLYIGESSFDTNMVVLLLSLLCVLICVMGLNSIVRCALRCTRSRAALLESEDMVAVRVANTGLKRKALRALPTAVYGAAGSKLRCTDCPICLAEFVAGEEVRLLPKCNHGFHVHCIDTWLCSHSSCPTCRQNLLELPRISSNEGNTIINASARAASPSTPAALHVQVEAR